MKQHYKCVGYYMLKQYLQSEAEEPEIFQN